MDLIQKFNIGYESDCWNGAPIYRGGTWKQRVELGVPSIEGLVIDAYGRNNADSEERLFAVDVVDEIEDGQVVLYFTAKPSETGNISPRRCSVYVTCQIHDTDTQDIYPIVQGDVPVGVGVLA